VFVQREPGDRLHIVIAGKVKIGNRSPNGQENLLAILGPSDMFCELSVFDPGPRTSSATIITEVRAVSMDRDALRTWIADLPDIAEQLLRVLARRLRRTNNNLADLIFTDVPGRVAKLLLQLAQRFGTQDDAALRVTHELTQEEMAQPVGDGQIDLMSDASEPTPRRTARGHSAHAVESARSRSSARMTGSSSPSSLFIGNCANDITGINQYRVLLITSHNLFVLMIMDSVPLARLAVLLAPALAASATVGVLVAVPVFHLVAVPVPLPVGYLRWEVLAQTRIQPVSYDLCSNSWCSSAPSILSTPLADLVPVHRCCRGSANCTTRH